MDINDKTTARRAVFLDRDGVLTVEKGYVCTPYDLEIFKYSRECVDIIHQRGYLAIVVTNQSGIARGLFNEEILKTMNDALITETGVDAVYYCPHYPQGRIERYSVPCNCRKPQIGMVVQAFGDYGIISEGSFMVGDRASDIVLGQNAGLKTVLLESGYGTGRLEVPVKPDYVFEDLRDFVDIL